MKKTWKLKQLYPVNGITQNRDFDTFVSEMRELKTKIQLPDLIVRLLYLRGVSDYQKVIKFFKPTYERTYSPFLMKDCDIACARVLKAIEDKEKVMIVGDYDVDGTCGASMLHLFLKNFSIDSDIYIPNRIEEGYGISELAIDKAKEQDIKLIISVDCGITASEKVDYSNKLGIEFIICDHHQPPEKIPEALAVLDPLRVDCEYPFKYLCGTGVAFKLIQAVCSKLNMKSYAKSLLDFVAIATASDIVPIVDENRIFVSEGLKMLNANPRPSFKTLVESAGLQIGNINTTNIVFSVAPRINAVGRLGDAKRAVELLTSIDESEQDELANTLNEENDKRREFDKSITEEAFKIYEDSDPQGTDQVIVLHNGEWHSGVIGIVAARLVEKYNKPSIVLTTVKGVAKGSARSINGFNIYEALRKCENMLIQFGGHYHAAGLEIEIDKIAEFRKEFNIIATEEIIKAQLQPEIEVDSEIEFEEITPKMKKIISFFEPFGPGNTPPIFVSYDTQIVGDVRLAKSETHIFKLRQSKSPKAIDTIFFGSGEYKDKLVKGAVCDICFSIEKNNWNNIESYKLRIRDIRFKE